MKSEVINLQELDPQSSVDDNYQLFIEYNDGNYHRGTDMKPPFNVNTNFKHDYLPSLSGSVNYSPSAILFDRKTDNPPPFYGYTAAHQIASFPIPSGSGALDPINYPASVIDYTGDADYCSALGMDYSPFLENGIWTAFVLGYRPPPGNGALFFFYDDNKNQVGDQYEQETTKKSKYGSNNFLNGNVVQLDVGPGYPNYDYDKVLIYFVQNGESTIDKLGDNNRGPEELRIFHYLKSKNLIPGNLNRFLAILTSSTDLGSCADFNLARDNAFITDYISYDRDRRPRINFSDYGYYYVDAVQHEIKEGDPEDPNELSVKDICQCEDGKYQVTFGLKFCNISPFPTTSSTVYLKDLRNIYSCFGIPADSYNNSEVTVVPKQNQPCPENVSKCLSRNFNQGNEKLAWENLLEKY